MQLFAGGHVIVLPAGDQAIIDDAHHHDQAPGRRTPLPRWAALMLDFVLDPMAYGFMQRGLVAAILVGVVCAVMGAFVVLRGLAFIGDAVSHAAFPGLVIAYMLGVPLYIGGAVAAVGTALAIGAVIVARSASIRYHRRRAVRRDVRIRDPIFSTLKGYASRTCSATCFWQRPGDHLLPRHHRGRDPAVEASSC